METPTPPDGPRQPDDGDRRVPEPLLYTADQLLGHAPIRLRRRTDKLRLAGHLVAAVALIVLSAWWVIPLHSFAGPVLVVVTPGHGIHAGDLPTVAFLALALRSLRAAGLALRLLSNPPAGLST